MSKNQRLSVLVLVFAVLLGGYFIIKTVVQKQEILKNQVEVMQIDTGDVEKITWSDGADTNTLILKDDIWQYEGDDAFPVDQKYPRDMLDALSDIKAERTVDAQAELSEYGLDKPSFTITAAKKDQTVCTIAIGDTNDITSSSYMKIDNGSIFMMESGFMSTFDYCKDDLMLHDEIPNVNKADKIEVKSGETAVIAEKSDDRWRIEDTAVDTAKVEQILTQISQITLDDYDTYQADETVKAEYGVTEATGTKVTVSYVDDKSNKKQFVFYLGNDASNQYHVSIENSKLVYKISKADAEAIASVSAESLKADDAEDAQETEEAQNTDQTGA